MIAVNAFKTETCLDAIRLQKDEQPLQSLGGSRQTCNTVQSRKQRVVSLTIRLHLRLKRIERLHEDRSRCPVTTNDTPAYG